LPPTFILNLIIQIFPQAQPLIDQLNVLDDTLASIQNTFDIKVKEKNKNREKFK